MNEMRTGIQLYTIREPLAQDFKGVCKELVKLHCDGVEFAGEYGGMAPDELAAFMQETGLTACGLHSGVNELMDPAGLAYQYAKALGVANVTCSAGGDFASMWYELSEKLESAGRVAAEKGFQLTYHNHASEFAKIGGESALDLIYENTNPEFVQAELDVYWITKGGENAPAYIRRYRDRVPEIHLKDMDPADGSFTELGRGTVDLASCVLEAKRSICGWLIYEQDICKRPQFESAAISLEHMNKLLGR